MTLMHCGNARAIETALHQVARVSLVDTSRQVVVEVLCKFCRPMFLKRSRFTFISVSHESSSGIWFFVHRNVYRNVYRMCCMLLEPELNIMNGMIPTSSHLPLWNHCFDYVCLTVSHCTSLHNMCALVAQLLEEHSMNCSKLSLMQN